MNRRQILKMMAALPMMPAALKDKPVIMLPPEVAKMPLKEVSTNTTGLREDMVGTVDGVPAYFTHLNVSTPPFGYKSPLGPLNMVSGSVEIIIDAKLFGPGADAIHEKVLARGYRARLCAWEMGTGVVGDIQRSGEAYAMELREDEQHGLILTLRSTQPYTSTVIT